MRQTLQDFANEPLILYSSPLSQTQLLSDLRPAEKLNMVRRFEIRTLPVRWRGSSERQSIRSTVISTDSRSYTLAAANIHKRWQMTLIPSCQALSMSVHLFPHRSHIQAKASRPSVTFCDVANIFTTVRNVYALFSNDFMSVKLLIKTPVSIIIYILAVD